MEKDFPASFDIEFKDVWFKYPGTKKDILKGLSFKIKDGEKASIVGENGEGKSTMIKLLLGLFSPDKGEIYVSGKKLDDYPLHVRTKIFGPVFQDFPRYSITLKENIGIGAVDEMDNDEKIKTEARKSGAESYDLLFVYCNHFANSSKALMCFSKICAAADSTSTSSAILFCPMRI